jgi:hypothetical protein
VCFGGHQAAGFPGSFLAIRRFGAAAGVGVLPIGGAGMGRMDGWRRRLEWSSPRRAVPGWGLALLTSSHRWPAGFKPSSFTFFCWCDGPAGSMDREGK